MTLPARRKAPCRALLAATAASALGAAPAHAEQLIDLMPKFDFTDSNGVDLAAAALRLRELLLSVGEGAGAFELGLQLTSPGLIPEPGSTCWPNGISGVGIGRTIYSGLTSNAYYAWTGGSGASLALPGKTAKFYMVGQRYQQPDGSYVIPPSDVTEGKLTADSSVTYFDYVGPDGSKARLSSLHKLYSGANNMVVWANADEAEFPNGEKWTYRYNDADYRPSGCPLTRVSRLRSLVSSRGYAFQFDYESEATGTLTSAAAFETWMSPVRITAYNKAHTACDETLLQKCAAVAGLSSAVTFVYGRTAGQVLITRPNGEQMRLTITPSFHLGGPMITRIEYPTTADSAQIMTYVEDFDQDNVMSRYLATLSKGSLTWRYEWVPGGSGGAQTVATSPLGAQAIVNSTNGMPFDFIDANGRTTSVGWISDTRMYQRIFPEGNYVYVGYDGRGNPNLVRQAAKPGSGLPAIDATATYPASCAAATTCNQPASTTDTNGNVTDFTYAAAHGGKLTETGPAVNGVRPQTRYSYAQRYPRVKNGAGSYVPAAAPIWVLTQTSSCKTSAATGNPAAPCAVAGDEVRTTFEYGPDTGPNNLLLRGTVVDSGGLSLRTCFAHDPAGNRISSTSPRAGLASCP